MELTPSNAGDITLENLQKAWEETQWPKASYPEIPNPCDINPELWEALKSRCVMVDGVRINEFFTMVDFGVKFHVRTDVENWKLNPCTCPKEPKITWPQRPKS